jgi:hypothetical protein
MSVTDARLADRVPTGGAFKDDETHSSDKDRGTIDNHQHALRDRNAPVTEKGPIALLSQTLSAQSTTVDPINGPLLTALEAKQRKLAKRLDRGEAKVVCLGMERRATASRPARRKRDVPAKEPGKCRFGARCVSLILVSGSRGFRRGGSSRSASGWQSATTV